jgi:serine/threonine protein kinase
LKKLGEGTYGDVWLARDSIAERLVALKRIKVQHAKDIGLHPSAVREISVLRELEHENIVALEDVIVEEADGASHVSLVFEHLDCDLHKRIKSFPVTCSHMTRRYMFQLLEAVAYIHERRVLHRDLKPQNILWCRAADSIKICDFGLTRVFNVESIRELTSEVATLWYRAPEVLLGCAAKGGYGPAMDVWSVGCIFAELARGRALFPSRNTEIDQLALIFRLLGTPDHEKHPELMGLSANKVTFKTSLPPARLSSNVPLSASGLDLLSRMLEYEPSKRITAADALKHRYFDGVRCPDEPPPLKRLKRD